MRRNWLISYAAITLGTSLIAFAFEAFLSPNHVLVSGTGGVAILLAHFIPVPLGVVYLLLNVPLFLVGWREVGLSFLLKSIWGTVSLSLFLVVMAHAPSFKEPLIAGIVGGLLSGLAVGFVLLAGGTTGGTDIVSVVVNQRSRWSIGRIMFVINGLIVLAGGFVFGLVHALITIVSLLFTSGAVNVMLKLGGWRLQVGNHSVPGGAEGSD